MAVTEKGLTLHEHVGHARSQKISKSFQENVKKDHNRVSQSVSYTSGSISVKRAHKNIELSYILQIITIKVHRLINLTLNFIYKANTDVVLIYELCYSCWK